MSQPGGAGRELFIVDNSVTGWTAGKYLIEWTGIAKQFDIATGYFEIGSLLMLGDNWRRLDKIRILMGSEMTQRTRRILTDALKSDVDNRLDKSIDAERIENPLLAGVQAIVQGLESGQIECRVYNRGKFHAKAYITHARLEVVGAQALVGSSNFTGPGLSDNIELNVQVQSSREVAQLQEWYEQYWEQSDDITDQITELIQRQIAEIPPFIVYVKALHEYFRGYSISSSQWDETHSRMFKVLDLYQKEAYWSLLKISNQHGGAFLCDGVGLGKTFVGLMLIERLVLHEGKRVVLFAPKAAAEGVWKPHLEQWLPHIGGTGGSADFSNLAVFNHTDLGRRGEYPDRFRRITALADVVIIDEAHHFRNPGKRAAEGSDPSRYWTLYDLLSGDLRDKQVYLLTATPINNKLADFRHLVELFSRGDEAYFARTLGVNNLRAHFAAMDKALRSSVDSESTDLSEHIVVAEEKLTEDIIFKELVVQRSRSYAKASQLAATGMAAIFPDRSAPQVANYSIRKTYGQLLLMFEAAFSQKNLFSLPMYYPLAWYVGEDRDIDPFEENRQKQVVGLIRTLFLKRFESSVAAFEASCDRLLIKLLAFLEVHSESDAEIKRLERWKTQNADALGITMQRQLDIWGDGFDRTDDELIAPELLAGVEYLARDTYNVTEMIQETFLDCDQLMNFLEEIKRFKPSQDDKLKKLIRLLKSKEIGDEKVIIFTEFADTARYLEVQLKLAGISELEEIDGSSKSDRANVIKRFSPYYNSSSPHELRKAGLEPIRVLISTDVLSEGLNLQDATRMVNYDIHWNPVRLMQRIGRVDRRMNPAIEARMISEFPKTEASRGKITFWNFLPPDELNQILTLYSKVTKKTLIISKTLGIEGRKLLTPDDNFDAIREFNHLYEGVRTSTEELHLQYQEILRDDPSLEIQLANLPNASFSGRALPGGEKGIFFCYALPALDRTLQEFTVDAGVTKWFFYVWESGEIREDIKTIVRSVQCDIGTDRSVVVDEPMFFEARRKVQLYIKNSYLKKLDAPISAKPVLRCWMDVN